MEVGAGGTIIYAIEMGNVGPAAATGVMITDTVPVGTAFNASLSSSGWTCADGSPAGTACEFDISAEIGGEFPGNSELSVIVTFAVDVVVPLPDGLTLIVNAVAIGDDGAHGPDVNPGDNFSVAVTPTAHPDFYEATGNVGIGKGAGAGLLSNDSDPDLPPQTLTATAETVASANGGSATIAADGSFS